MLRLVIFLNHLTLDTSPNMRSNPIVAIISEQAEQKRSGKTGKQSAAAKKARGQRIPDYEEVADWRGIERVLAASHQDPAIPRDLPGTLPQISFPIAPDDKPKISLSPMEMVEKNRSKVVVANMEEAISSASAALRPHLNLIAANEVRNAYQGTRTRSADTIEQYRNLVIQLLKQYFGQKGGKDIDDVAWPAFAEWFLSRKYDLKPSTWIIYRTAVVSHLERIPSDEAIYALAVIRTGDEPDLHTKTRDQDVDSKRIKKFRPDDFDRTIFYCQHRQSAGNHSLMTYLRANVRVGLRPAEFLTSEIRMILDSNAPFGRQVWMFVCNAKYTNGRANGPIRCIDLSEMNAAAIEAINNCIDDARLQNQLVGYKTWLTNLNRTLNNVAASPNSGLSDRYTAYSARHQAIANWKSMYDPVTVAALAGHALPNTAEMHYGKARDAWPAERMENMIVRPSSADIARIRNRMLMAKERRELAMGHQPTIGP
jgi:hypothetical protein